MKQSENSVEKVEKKCTIHTELQEVFIALIESYLNRKVEDVEFIERVILLFQHEIIPAVNKACDTALKELEKKNGFISLTDPNDV